MSLISDEYLSILEEMQELVKEAPEVGYKLGDNDLGWELIEDRFWELREQLSWKFNKIEYNEHIHFGPVIWCLILSILR